MSETSIQLPKSVKLNEAPALKEQLSAVLMTPSPVTLDASAVESIDYSGLQLLLAFCRERNMKGLSVDWAATSEPFEIAADHLGASAYLGLFR